MNNSYMHNYIDILNESLGDGYSYYITDNLPIFNIDGLIETHQYDIRNILTEASNNKGKTLIDKIRMIGKKILSFLHGILEKITSFFKKLRNFIRSKIQKMKSGKNDKGSEEIIDSNEYSRRKRNKKNKNDNDDEVDEEKLNTVRHKDDIAEEKRQEEEKRRKEEEKRRKEEEEKRRQKEERIRQEEEKKKRRREENRDTIEKITKRKEKYSSIEVYKDMDYKGGIAATNKLLDVFQDGFRDYVMEVEKFNNVDSILYSMGIELNDRGLKRTTDVKDRDRINKVIENFRALTRKTDTQIYTNGKISTSDKLKEERDKIKQIFYGSGEKVNILDFKGTVDDDPYEHLKSIDDRIAKIEASTKNVCEKTIANSKAFMNQLEGVAKRIEETGEENFSLSNLISVIANAYVQVIHKLSSALRSQTSDLRSISMTVTNAANSANKIGSTLDDINTADFILKQYESYNDYDGMNWLRDILFE